MLNSNIILLLFVSLFFSFSQSACPQLEGIATKWPKTLPINQTEDCLILWDGLEHFEKKIRDRLTKREKVFVRFRVPVDGNNVMTIIWVSESHQPMLHYPHNFETLSLATMNIITESLVEKNIVWKCPTHCITCGLGKQQLETVLRNITESLDVHWKYLCIHADYGMSHILDDYPKHWSIDMFNTYNFALPDMLYYWYFLKMLFITQRPPLGFASNKEDFPNYYCYNNKNECVIKELHIHYWVVVYLAFILWLYCPLMVYYLPSSKPSNTVVPSKDMFPSYKSPIHFTRCFQYMLCYYSSKNQDSCVGWKIRLRRLLFLLFLAVFSFRLLLLSEYCIISWIAFVSFVIAAVVPTHMSVYVEPDIPKSFPLFSSTPYPNGVVKLNEAKNNKVEYQLLAYNMKERIFIALDKQFWIYLFRNSFKQFHNAYKGYTSQSVVGILFCFMKLFVLFLAGIALLLLSVSITVLYFIIPMPYFFKELCYAIFRGETKYAQASPLKMVAGIAHGIVILCLLVYVATSLFVACYLITDISMYTYMGSSLTPTMALEYVALLGSCGTTIYSLVKSLHENYDAILDNIVNILTDEKTFEALKQKLEQKQNMKLLLVKDETYGVYVRKVGETLPYERILSDDSFTSYVSKDLYFAVVEHQLPIRRQVFFIFLKTLLTITYVLLAMMVKNVYHLENKVTDIFALASEIAIYFLPAFLQSLAYSNTFGRKSDIIQKKETLESMIEYISIMAKKA